MTKPVFVNGKARLDECYLCGESKGAIKYSQSRKNPIYCVLMGTASEAGPAEAIEEYDHHVFVIAEKAYLADINAERDWFEATGAGSDWVPPF